MTFQPAFRNPHVQTVLGAWLRESVGPAPGERKVRISDDLWGSWEPFSGDRLLVVIHGLGGNRLAGHSRSLGRAWRQARLGPVLRLSLPGSETMPGTPRLYHGGSWHDLQTTWDWLGDWAAHSVWAGFSLGANILVHWLGRTGACPAAAVSACNPWNLRSCSQHLEASWSGRSYRRRLVERLKPRALELDKRFPGHIDPLAVKAAGTFAQYDTAVTVPLHGFADLNDYYDSSSSDQYLERVQTRLLCLDALDDPLVASRPRCRYDNVEHELTPCGGHLGYLGWERLFWMEERIVNWAQRRLGRSSTVMVT